MKPPLDDLAAPGGRGPRCAWGGVCPPELCLAPSLCDRLDIPAARSMPRPAVQRHGKPALDWAAAVALCLACWGALAWGAHWLWGML